jgi:gamma-glutamylcyclotransferase (GGCT)/AIG2-like uncharacterized protein YtfP
MAIVVVYGTLKAKGSRGQVLQGAKFLGSFKSSPEYTMYNIGSYPAIAKRGSTEIVCEAYETDDEALLSRLDGIEGVSFGLYSKQDMDTPYGKGLVYVAGPELEKDITNYQLEEIVTGEWPC